MPSDTKPNLPLEIGHVLLIDIVGYSQLLINEQGEQLHELNDIVRQTEQVRAADAAGKLLRLPTGDGVALVFRDSPERPAECAMEIARALRSREQIAVRMGIHSGPVSEIADVNERANIATAGINIAQRVMDCGDAGHILLSQRVADDLAQYRHWQPLLHDLGTCEVKHGLVVSIANLYSEEIGNPTMPAKLQQEKAGRMLALRRKSLLVGGGILVAIALLCALWFFKKTPVGETARAAPAAVASTASPAEKRIAVLPFKPLVPTDRDQVLEMGMADSLITKLSNSRQVIVTSLTSVRRYGGLEQDPIAAGRALGVDSVLDGSVQKAGDQIRVSARLIKVATGASLWAGTFDEKFTGVFSVQNTISQKVADALALSLSGAERARLTKSETQDVAAYQLYLTGRYHWNKLTPPEIQQSITFYQQAIALDPNYALAYFGLADAYRSLTITSDVRPEEIVPKAKGAAQKAIALEPTMAEPHAVLAFLHMWYDWDWARAEAEAQRAVSLNPNSAFAHLAYAHVLSISGRHEEALREAQRALMLDPVSLLVNTLHGIFLLYAGQDDAAATSLHKTLALDPNFWIAHLSLAKVALKKKNYPEALAELDQARNASNGNFQTLSLLGYTQARAGDGAGAQKMLDELLARSAERYTPPCDIALIYLGQGNRDEAFAWLDKAYAEHDVLLSFLKAEPHWSTLRSDPRFAALLKRIGLD